MAIANPFHSISVRTAQLPFVNEEFVDFTAAENKRTMLAALSEVESNLNQEYDLVIGGRRLQTADKILSTNPARPSQIIGIHQKAEVEHAEQAMQAAQEAFLTWSRTDVAERAALLFRAADLIRERKFESAPGLPTRWARTGPRRMPM